MSYKANATKVAKECNIYSYKPIAFKLHWIETSVAINLT